MENIDQDSSIFPLDDISIRDVLLQDIHKYTDLL